ncbi:MAG: hypothetical protein AB1631_07770 [Acidobacteriota bacterium]
MPRVFNLEKRLMESTTNAILDIPHFALLRHKTASDFVAEFKATWKVSPEGVVLPLTSHDGLLFKVSGLDDRLSSYARVSDDLKDYQTVIRAFADLGLGIYLLLEPRLSFIRSASLHVEDIIGQGSPILCIGNPRSQDLMAAIVGTGIDLVNETATGQAGGKLRGIVIDAVDLWGMGGRNKRLHLTCFCPSCRNFFNTAKPGLLQEFQDFPNPWNLLLQVTDTGIGHVDDIGLETKEDDIIGLSRQRGYYEVFEDKSPANLRKHADLLRQYVATRHDQTLLAIDEIFKQAFASLSSHPTRVLLLEGVNYGWTSGLQLDRLDAPNRNPVSPYDEIWFDPSSSDLFLKRVPFRSYMWTRSRYFIDAFFDLAGDVSDPVKRATTGIARFSPTRLRDLLRSRLNQAVGTGMTGLTSLASLPDLQSEQTESKRVGFVGVALDRQMGENFIESIAISEGLAQVEQIATPDINEIMQMFLSRMKADEEEKI